MLYFILWTVAILVILLSIPVAHFVEVSRQKKQLAASHTDSEVPEDEMAEGEVQEVEEEVDEVVEMSDAADDGFSEFEGEPVEGGDDFSAFDEAFDDEKR